MKRFLYVGNWGFHPAPKGISVFSYDDETGNIALIENVRQDIAAGQLCLDEANGILYAVNECGDRPGEYGGGGRLLAFRLDAETGHPELINERDSLCPEPSYLCMDPEKKYIMACHCADPWHVTKIVRNEDGTLSNRVLFDDGAIVLYRLMDDGGIGDAVDYLTWPCTNVINDRHQVMVDPVSGHIQLTEIISRLHSIVRSPDGRMYVACDKGMDRIYAFRLDDGKLSPTDTFEATWKSFPRYAAFHPTLKRLYTNSEFSGEVNIFDYDSQSGHLKHLGSVSAVDRDYGLVDGKPVGAQDILVHPEGHVMYVTTCGIDSISVFSLDNDGMPCLKQVIHSGGVLPRGIAISPDRRFLLSGNMVSGDITLFRINEDGTLQGPEKTFAAVSPSALRFFPG